MKFLATLVLIVFAVIGFLAVFKVYRDNGGVCIAPRNYVKSLMREKVKAEKLREKVKKLAEDGDITPEERRVLEHIIKKYEERGRD